MGRASRRTAKIAGGRPTTPPHPDRPSLRWIAIAAAFLVGIGAARFILSARSAPVPAPAQEPAQQEATPRPTAATQALIDQARKQLDVQALTEAQRDLERAQALAPDDAEVAFLLGDVAYRSLQMQAAERHYRRAAELDPRSSAAFGNLALVLLELGQARQAADAAKQATALDPRNARLHAVLGQCLLRLGDARAAADLLERAVGQGVRGAHGYAALGRARDLLGQTDAALLAFDEALRQDPYLPLARYWRADCFRRTGRRQEAERELAVYRRNQGLMERLARAEFRVQQTGDDASALLELARLRVERGIASQAVHLVHRAEQLAPSHPDVKRVGDLVRRAAATRPDVES